MSEDRQLNSFFCLIAFSSQRHYLGVWRGKAAVSFEPIQSTWIPCVDAATE